MQCLRCLCVQCRDPMNLVDTHNGVSVPDGTGRLVTLHSECFVAWLNAQVKNEPKPNFQTNLPAVPTSGRGGLIWLFVREPRRTLEYLSHLPILRRHHPESRS
jgi:hypothetical protein